MQMGAEEKLVIRINSVTARRTGLLAFSGKREVVVKATVESVTASANGLRRGDMITIRYRHTPLNGRAGPSAIPILKKGAKVPAWLDKSGDEYSTAARAFSFSEISD